MSVRLRWSRTFAALCATLALCVPGCQQQQAPAVVDDAGEPLVPQLDPLTQQEAVALAAYARRLRVVTPSAPGDHPVAWSMVNISCQDRTMALEFAVAQASTQPRPETPLLDARSLGADDVLALGERAARTIASINITGPLITRQTLVLPDGSVAPGEPGRFYWPYHHAAVVNVEGELRVLDLSIGDEPTPLPQWTRGFVVPDHECELMTQAQFDKLWLYWLPAFSNLIPPKRPDRLCGYTITPIFTLEHGEEPQTGAVIGAADAMFVQLGSLQTRLRDSGVTLDDEALPDVVSRYTPQTEAALCGWVHLNYCDRL